MAGLGLRPVSDRPGQADWAVLDAIEALDRLRPASLKPGGLGWGWLRRVAGWAGPEASLSHECEAMGGAGQLDYGVGCAWNFGWLG